MSDPSRTTAEVAECVRPLLTVCPVCEGSRLHYQFSIGSFRVVRCHDCSLMFSNPQPSNAELNELHRHRFDDLESAAAVLASPASSPKTTADQYLDLLVRYGLRHAARILHVSPAPNDFVSRAQARGFAATSIVLNQRFGGSIPEFPETAGSFDAVVLADALTMVRDPRALLSKLHRILAADGILFLATPSLESWPARLLRTRWPEFRSEHLWHFKPLTLESLLYQMDFARVIRCPGVRTLSFDELAASHARHSRNWTAPLAGIVRKWLPSSIRHAPRRLVGSGMILMARREERRERPKLSVVVPAFNEAATFATAFDRLLAKEVPGVDLEIVVIESNSTDGTREIVARYAEHPRVTIIWEDRPRGKGHAVRAGLEKITGDFVMIQDADLEYDLEDYDQLLEPLLHGRQAFVLGARHGGSAWKMRQFSGQPILSAVLNMAHWFFTFLVNFLFGAHTRDPFTMYKVFRRDCLYGLKFECDRFDFDFELVIKLLRKGYKPLEIPVNYRSRSFTEGKKVSFFGDPLTWLRALVKFRLVRQDPLAEIARRRATHPESAAATASTP